MWQTICDCIRKFAAHSVEAQMNLPYTTLALIAIELEPNTSRPA